MAAHNPHTQSTSTSLSLSLPLLQSSLTSLSAALATLDACTADLPRLSHVLTSTRHFELLHSSTLAAAQTTLVDEIQPEVLRLLQVVESVVERRERRGEWLRARWGLYEGRLGRDEVGGRSGGKAASAAGNGQGASTGAADDLKTQRLRQKKERLSYAVERLQLQAQQKERQLRMSMAQQGVAVGDKAGVGRSGVGAEGEDDDDDDDDDDDFRV